MLLMRSNFSQPVALLVSVCDHIPDGLLEAYYSPMDMQVLVLTGVCSLMAGLAVWKLMMCCGCATCLIDNFREWVWEQGQDTNEAEEMSQEDIEARRTFYWALNIVLLCVFAADYFYNKLAFGTQKTGWQACTSKEFLLVSLYKPCAAPMLICLLKLQRYISRVRPVKGKCCKFRFVGGTPKRPKSILFLMFITLLLWASWLTASLIYLPVGFINLMGFVVYLLFFRLPEALLRVVWEVCLGGMKTLKKREKELEMNSPEEEMKEQVAKMKNSWLVQNLSPLAGRVLYRRAVDAITCANEPEAQKDTEIRDDQKLELLLQDLLRENFSKTRLVSGFLFYGYFPMMASLMYHEPSCWPKLMVLIWNSSVTMVKDSIRFSWLT